MNDLIAIAESLVEILKLKYADIRITYPGSKFEWCDQHTASEYGEIRYYFNPQTGTITIGIINAKRSLNRGYPVVSLLIMILDNRFVVLNAPEYLLKYVGYYNDPKSVELVIDAVDRFYDGINDRWPHL